MLLLLLWATTYLYFRRHLSVGLLHLTNILFVLIVIVYGDFYFFFYRDLLDAVLRNEARLIFD